eukprot:9495703-Pyramimonas_sp.AAC.1
MPDCKPRPEEHPPGTWNPPPAKAPQTVGSLKGTLPQDAQEHPTNTKNTKVPSPNQSRSYTSVRLYHAPGAKCERRKNTG